MLKHKLFLSLLFVSTVILLIFGCGENGNIMQAKNPDLVAQDYFELGKIAFRATNDANHYTKALKNFDIALEMDSTSSSACYWGAKTYLRMYGIFIGEIYQEIQSDSLVPFIGSGQTIEEVNMIYHPFWVAYNKYLILIVDGPALDGVWTANNMSLELTTIGAVIGPLSIIDKNNDGRLDPDTLGGEYELFTLVQRDLSDWNNITFDVDEIRDITKDPDTINVIINDFLFFIDSVSLKNLNVFNTSLEESADKGLDPEKEETFRDATEGTSKLLEKISYTAKLYLYDDYKDNDGDWFDTDGNAKQDTMHWEDFDRDSLIDIQFGTDSLIQNDGDIHLFSAQHMYDSNGNLIDSLYRFTLSPIDSTDTIFIYIGPYSGEFLSGDFGVDEEIMDGKDNDGDGRVDEDTKHLADDPTFGPNE